MANNCLYSSLDKYKVKALYCKYPVSPYGVIDEPHILPLVHQLGGFLDEGQVVGLGVHGHHVEVPGSQGQAVNTNVGPDV